MYEERTNFIVKDGSTWIPKSEKNSDYREYLAWVAAGNTPSQYAPDPEDLAEANMLKCEQHFSVSGYTPIRIIDCQDMILSGATGAKLEKLMAVKAWMKSCRDLVFANPVAASYDFPPPPHKYTELQ